MIRISLRRLFVGTMTVLLLGTVGTSKASADTFDLDVVFADTLGDGNYGTVELVVDGTDILVTVTLNPPYQFHDAGLTTFSFNGPAGLTAADFSIVNADGSTWALEIPSDNADGAGAFAYGFSCAAAPNGCTGFPNTFSFRILGQNNLALFETTANGTDKPSKTFFAVNLADSTQNDCTGIVGAGGAETTGEKSSTCSTPTVVPEPASLFLLGSGLALAGYRFRRKGNRKDAVS